MPARIRLSRAGRASHRAQQIANRRADRKKTGILACKAHDLQAERQALGRQYRQRQGGMPSIEAGTLKTGLPGKQVDPADARR